jgi:hypothetical protein
VTTYKFISKVSIEDGTDILLTVACINEPGCLDYVKSFFGLLTPWPRVIENIVQFEQYQGRWFEHSSDFPISRELNDGLTDMVELACKLPLSTIVIKI